MSRREIKALHPSVRDDIADLVTRRPLPGRAVPQIDPFLFLNHHGPQVYPPRNGGLPFGPHPHRGFETVTFILDGSLAHSDTGGHESIIHAGGVQWMTAGRGLVHAELSPDDFRRDGGPLEILQLWVNLPSHLKMTAPRYVGLQRADIPSLQVGEGAKLQLIAGEWGASQGAIEPLLDMFMSTIELAINGRVKLQVPPDRNVFLYLVRGDWRINGIEAPAHHLVEFHNTGDEFELASPSGGTVLFGHTSPLGEPVVSHGPFVMNTREEIMAAIRDYQAGEFDRPVS